MSRPRRSPRTRFCVRVLAGTWLPLLISNAVFAAQCVWTWPRVITFVEYRLLLLIAGPCAVVALSTWWVASGPSVLDPERD